MTRNLKIDLGQGDTLRLLEDFDGKGTGVLLYQRSPDHDPQTLVLPGKLLLELADRLAIRKLEEAGARLEKIPAPPPMSFPPIPVDTCPCGTYLHVCLTGCPHRLAPYLPCQVCLSCGLPRADRIVEEKTPVRPLVCPCGSILHTCTSDCGVREDPAIPCRVCLQCGLPRSDRATPPKTSVPAVTDPVRTCDPCDCLHRNDGPVLKTSVPSEVKIPESEEEKTGELPDWTCAQADCGRKNSALTVYCPCGHSGNPNMTQTERYEEWRRREKQKEVRRLEREGVQPRIAFCPACGNVASPHRCPGPMF